MSAGKDKGGASGFIRDLGVVVKELFAIPSSHGLASLLDGTGANRGQGPINTELVFRNREAGFTYIAVLIFVAITSAALAASGMLYSDSARREREADLLFVGDQYRQAIVEYRKKENRYPATLAVLVEKRHLRRLYRDPISGSAEWGLVPAPDKGGITGVYSLAEGQPFKTAGFAERDKEFAGAGSYAQWRFVVSP